MHVWRGWGVRNAVGSREGVGVFGAGEGKGVEQADKSVGAWGEWVVRKWADVIWQLLQAGRSVGDMPRPGLELWAGLRPPAAMAVIMGFIPAGVWLYVVESPVRGAEAVRAADAYARCCGCGGGGQMGVTTGGGGMFTAEEEGRTGKVWRGWVGGPPGRMGRRAGDVCGDCGGAVGAKNPFGLVDIGWLSALCDWHRLVGARFASCKDTTLTIPAIPDDAGPTEFSGCALFPALGSFPLDGRVAGLGFMSGGKWSVEWCFGNSKVVGIRQF
ncbi:hypothetical protein Tco_1459493 [Tanacetum coccineum]